MVRVKSAAEIDRKFREGIGRAPAAYKAGVASVNDWQERAVAGQGLYEERMRDSNVLARRGKALASVSNEEWKRKASDLGASRIGAGMAANADKRTRNFEPYRQTLEGLQLPERSADPLQNVTNRVGGVVKALVDKKRSL